ncbi:MAG TPA: ABC transporter ATP-binding protein [Bacillota bacterium]|nr:ABC transporter ATP-binding protein [Bacillota bacterium]
MRTLLRLWREARRYSVYFSLAAAAMLIITGINLWTPLLVKEILAILRTSGSKTETLTRIGQWSLLLLLAYLCRTGAQFIARYYSHVGGWRLVAHMRTVTYNHLQKLSLGFFQDKQTGQLLSRTVNDNANLENLVAHAIPDALTNVLLFTGVTVILFTQNARLAFYALAPIPGLAFLIIRFNRVIRPSLRKAQAKLGDLNAVVQENLSGIKEVQVFTQEERESHRVFKSAWDYTSGILAALKKTAFYHPAIELFGSVGTLVVLWFGARMVITNASITPETIVAFILYLSMFYGPITAAGNIIEAIQTSLAGAERVFEILDTEPDIKDASKAYALPKVAGEIRFEEVSFAYQPGELVLEKIRFQVSPGETLALVGPTGVGKTTIASLIPRFYDPDEGRILIDGHDLRNVTLESLRNQISLVLQDVFLFNGTIAENIQYGAPAATEEAIVAAARSARAHDFIQQFPNGYQTYIGERGVRLSGGQKQRLAIARALLRDAPILILDEATSAVDSETEALIQEALRELIRNRTTIIIAHRLSTIREADQILVLNERGIAEAGRHEELLKKNGIYARMCKIQFKEGIA